MTDPLPEVRAWVEAAGQVCVLTGAGMSAESGVPTFRDALSGLWARYDPQELATEAGFRSDPQLVWDWYASRREGVRAAEPNAGHMALARWQAAHPGRMTVVTQNVDDLHQRAGSTEVLCLHGSLFVDAWLDPCPRLARGELACDPRRAAPGRPPRCEACGNLVRPGVVWFGEALPWNPLDGAQRAARHCTLMLVVGTSGMVYPAAGLPGVAKHCGARVVVINPHPTELDGLADVVLRGTAAQLLPQLLLTP
ncbi:MAG TPA: NAD-dependent deacylase [Burkholderiaceae bacterium]|nr:NAD-dependent deacylase [Burkholderiaceae bacterium]